MSFAPPQVSAINNINAMLGSSIVERPEPFLLNVNGERLVSTAISMHVVWLNVGPPSLRLRCLQQHQAVPPPQQYGLCWQHGEWQSTSSVSYHGKIQTGSGEGCARRELAAPALPTTAPAARSLLIMATFPCLPAMHSAVPWSCHASWSA